MNFYSISDDLNPIEVRFRFDYISSNRFDYDLN